MRTKASLQWIEQQMGSTKGEITCKLWNLEFIPQTIGQLEVL